MKRRLFNLAATVLSLALCIGTLALWARSSICVDEFIVFRNPGTCILLRSCEGTLYCSYAHADPPGARLAYLVGPKPQWEAAGLLPRSRTGQFSGLARFRFSRGPLTDYDEQHGFYRNGNDPGTEVTTPIWPITVLAAILPVRWLYRKLRRPAPGFCLTCGYDLRATPGRCPECGNIPDTIAN